MRTGTAEQLHWLDQTTINGDLETGLLLMERASRGLTDVALQYLENEAEEGELAAVIGEAAARTLWRQLHSPEASAPEAGTPSP